MIRIISFVITYAILIVITVLGTYLNYKINGKEIAILVLVLEVLNIAILSIGLILIN